MFSVLCVFLACMHLLEMLAQTKSTPHILFEKKGMRQCKVKAGNISPHTVNKAVPAQLCTSICCMNKKKIRAIFWEALTSATFVFLDFIWTYKVLSLLGTNNYSPSIMGCRPGTIRGSQGSRENLSLPSGGEYIELWWPLLHTSMCIHNNNNEQTVAGGNNRLLDFQQRRPTDAWSVEAISREQNS